MALSLIIPGSTPFGSWAASASPPIGNPSDPGYDATVIMRWRSVPYQTIRKLAPQIFDEQVLIAANAYHLNGIKEVRFAAQGGG
jgi:hypothetical protein